MSVRGWTETQQWFSSDEQLCIISLHCTVAHRVISKQRKTTPSSLEACEIANVLVKKLEKHNIYSILRVTSCTQSNYSTELKISSFFLFRSFFLLLLPSSCLSKPNAYINHNATRQCSQRFRRGKPFAMNVASSRSPHPEIRSRLQRSDDFPSF